MSDGEHEAFADVGFLNFFTHVGPHNGATFSNVPRCIKQNVEWLTNLIADLRASGLKRVEPTTAAEVAWTEHVDKTARATLFPTVNSWFMGVNDNIPGRKKKFMLYAGGIPQ